MGAAERLTSLRDLVPVAVEPVEKRSECEKVESTGNQRPAEVSGHEHCHIKENTPLDAAPPQSEGKASHRQLDRKASPSRMERKGSQKSLHGAGMSRVASSRSALRALN